MVANINNSFVVATFFIFHRKNRLTPKKAWGKHAPLSYPLFYPSRKMEEDRPPSGSGGGGVPPEKGGYEEDLNGGDDGGGASSSSSSAAVAQPQPQQHQQQQNNADEPQALFDLNSGAAVAFAAVMILLHLFKGEEEAGSFFLVFSFRGRVFILFYQTTTTKLNTFSFLFPSLSLPPPLSTLQTPLSRGALAEKTRRRRRNINCNTRELERNERVWKEGGVVLNRRKKKQSRQTVFFPLFSSAFRSSSSKCSLSSSAQQLAQATP